MHPNIPAGFGSGWPTLAKGVRYQYFDVITACRQELRAFPDVGSVQCWQMFDTDSHLAMRSNSPAPSKPPLTELRWRDNSTGELLECEVIFWRWVNASPAILDARIA